MTSASLPRRVEALTSAWLTGVLQTSCPGVEVTAVTTEKIIWGTTTKVLINAEYKDNLANRPPSLLCIKGEFDDKLRGQLTGITITGTQVEASFYNDLAPLLGGMRLAKHWYGASEPGMGILILDNLAAQGVQFGDTTVPCSIPLVQQGLDVLAKLHAATWGKTYPQIPWLQIGSQTRRQYVEWLMSAAHWAKHFADPESFVLPPQLKNQGLCERAMQKLFVLETAHPDCVVHGDTHLGNTCADAEGRFFWIDWAGPCISSWAFDVAPFISGSLTIADRRASEHDLLKYYLARLKSYGGPELEFESAWQTCIRYYFYGITWATLPPSMQSRRAVQAMAERYTAAIIDHDVASLLLTH